MKNLTLIAILIAFLASGCEKREEKLVKYIATDAVSTYTISYRDQSGSVIKKDIEAQSAIDRWEYSFVAGQGEIVYVSGNYKDIGSALKVMILIDGKVYKQAATRGDTVRYVTVSGVIPY
ncbi:MAG: hypothetical protein IH598_09275 [Bacteroidales bacterium]|nr:hypothetical protein [Bacteroidales bacterium]